MMTEIEKLEAGLEYCIDDPEVAARKERAIINCRAYNAIDDTDYEAQEAQLKKILGAPDNTLFAPYKSLFVTCGCPFATFECPSKAYGCASVSYERRILRDS